MALSGLQIFKMLPGGKKGKEANCKKCGFPTCMAFAMKLAKGQTEMSKCEYISDELKKLLEDASQKQQEEVVFGPASNQIKAGNEIVMFRHDKTFINPTSICVSLNSNDLDFDSKLQKLTEYKIERVGQEYTISAIYLNDKDSSFAQKAQAVAAKNLPIILASESFENIKSALEVIKANKPLTFLKNANAEDLISINKEYKVPVVVSASTIDELVEINEKLIKENIKEIVLNLQVNPKTGQNSSVIEKLTYIRRAAIENKFKPLGFPVMTSITSTGNIVDDAIFSSTLLCKYSNLIVLEDFNPALISGLFTLSQNIYTDPQKPLQVESKLYEVGEVNKDSMVFITTNFALTYFAVISEIESSGVPAYLLITPSDGMSVLTAWSASKFTGEIIAKSVKEANLSELVNHRELIIPGLVSSLKEEIEEELPEWKVLVGTNDAIDIVDFIKAKIKNL